MHDLSLLRRQLGRKLRRLRVSVRRWEGRLLEIAVSGALIAIVTFMMLLALEGAASLACVWRKPIGHVPLERSHTEYDADLGWVNQGSIRIDNLYGPGAYLQTNSQRFRNRADFGHRVPANKIRAICTGDSFTLGYGVSNDDAWCELLTDADERLETVNMGQGGYGVDQAYLWYRRDGLSLDHDALVFAFTLVDITRVAHSSFMGYPKPVMALSNGTPVLARGPASRLSFIAPQLARRLRALRDLRVLELLRSERSSGEPPLDETVMSDAEAQALVLAMIDQLARVHAERGTSFMVVILPSIEDYNPGPLDSWRQSLHEQLAAKQIALLDLIDALRKEPQQSVLRLFRNHFSEVGNRWVADHVYGALSKLPHVAARLPHIGPPPRPLQVLCPPDPMPPLHPVSLDGGTLRANQQGELAPLAIDGSLSTRWHSGAMQAAREVLILDMKRPQRVRQIKLQLGESPSDWGRSLAVDVSNDDLTYTEVSRTDGDSVKLRNVGHLGEVRVLSLPRTVTSRFLRIRQLGTSNQNYWSVAEMEILSD